MRNLPAEAAGFIEEIKDEVRAITWPDAKSVIVASGVVGVVVAVSSVFFLLCDYAAYSLVSMLITKGG